MNVKDMTLRKKIGQMFTFPAFAPQIDEETSKLIQEYKIGGVFLGTGCLLSAEQIHRLTTDLQRLSLCEGSGDTLLISADFVAGVGCKVKEGAVHFPKNRAIGAASDEALAYETGKITAEESLAVGVNFNFSPVVDINNNPLNPVIGTHSFGEDREEVVRLGNAVIRGYQDHGLIATAKHFPGHGDTSIDSHEDLPVLPFTEERMQSFELVPFQKAVEAGVDAVMVGHIAVPSVDSSLTPASLSYSITTGILRKKLGFEGLIVTDGLSMKGITKKYAMPEACVMALQAGADILLATTDGYEQSVSMLQAVYDAVESGQLSEERINASIERILKVKEKYKLTAEYFSPAFRASELLTAAGKDVALSLARKALTPKGGIAKGVLGDLHRRSAIRLVFDERCAVFAHSLEAAGLAAITAEPFEDLVDAEQKLAGIETGSVIIAVTAGSKPIGPEAVNALVSRLKKFDHAIWVHFGSPYDVEETCIPCLLMYDFAPSLQTAAAEYLLERKLE